MFELGYITTEDILNEVGRWVKWVIIELFFHRGLCTLEYALNNYLQFQLQDLLFKLPHFRFFPVSGCLSCDSVFEFPEKKE